MESRRPFPRGRFTLLTSPAVLGWAFYLVTVLCERHHHGLSPQEAEFIGYLEDASRRAALVMALGAALVAVYLVLKARRWAEGLAFAIDAISALLIGSLALLSV